MKFYLDTSAAAKIIVEEAETDAIITYLDTLAEDDTIVSSALLETELRRIAVRLTLEQSAVSEVLGRIDLVDPPRSLFYEAGLLPGANLRSLDALHLATAVRVSADTFVAYDARLLTSAHELGLRTASPA